MTYNDIINLPHPQPARRARMPILERAAQFAPFAALTGFDGQIAETARLTDSRPVVSAEQARQINDTLNILIKTAAHPRVALTCFMPDGAKPGGALIDFEGEVRRVDAVLREVIFTDKTAIAIDDIFALAIL